MIQVHETKRLLLKILDESAAPLVLFFYENNKSQFEPWEPKRSNNFYTLSYQKASLTVEYNQMTEGKLLRYWIFLKDNPHEIIGSVCFQNFLKGSYQTCRLGYKLSHKYLHQGYALESVKECIKVIFEEFHMHRIEAFIMPNNDPSLRLIERLSFLCEGISYSIAKINGTWTDHIRYACINPDDR